MELVEVQNIARRIVGRRGRRLSPEDQHEVLQTVLMKYAAAWPTGQPANVEAWLETTTKRAVIDHGRAADRRKDDAVDEPPDLGADLFVHLRKPASLQAISEDLIATIVDLVPDGLLLLRRYVWNESSADVADDLGIKVAALDQRVSRARRKLREVLGQRPDLVAELRAGHPRLY